MYEEINLIVAAFFTWKSLSFCVQPLIHITKEEENLKENQATTKTVDSLIWQLYKSETTNIVVDTIYPYLKDFSIVKCHSVVSLGHLLKIGKNEE